MNSKDLVPLLAVYNKSTTEQTSMIKLDWITISLLTTFYYHSAGKGSEEKKIGKCATIMNKLVLGEFRIWSRDFMK